MTANLRQFLFRSVRGRLVLLVGSVAAPAAVLAAFLIFQSYENERASVGPKMLSTVRAICAVMDGEVDESDAILRGLGGTGAIERDDLPGLEANARRALDGTDRWFVLTDAQGQDLVDTRLPPTTASHREREPEFLDAMKRGDPYISDLRGGSDGDALNVIFSRPYLRAGQLKYILNIVIAPVALAKSLEIERFAPGSIIVVADRTGRIVARSRNADKYVGKFATADVVSATRITLEGVVDSVTLERIPVLAAFSRARCGWIAVIGSPKTELYTPARHLLILGLVCSGLLTLSAVVMASWIARGLLSSVDAVTEDAEALGSGRMSAIRSSGLEETDFVMKAMRRTAETLLRRTRTLQALNDLNVRLVGHRDVPKILEGVAEASRKVTGAAFASFYYNSYDEPGKPHWLHAFSGAPVRIAEQPDTPNDTPLFAGLLSGTGPMRVPDITKDARYSQLSPYHGLPPEYGPVRSFLAVPVRLQNSNVVGGIFLGHSEVDVFTQEAEEVILGLAAEAGIAIENAILYHSLKRELEAKSKTEAELRIAQARLQEHAAELEQKVEERTASLREAVAQMEEFSYTVSHDLRSPVRAMNGYAGLLIEEYSHLLDEAAKGYLQRIQRASERMDQLTTDVLSYSRVARSETQLKFTDVHELVRSTLEHYEELQPAMADVRVQLPLHPVLAHEPALRQCLANLLTNAVKFVKPGEKPQVVVRSEKKDGRVRIWIEDQGIGIPPQYQANLFRIFERVPQHREYEGTGVGLAIVRKAAEKLGGSCGVESDGKNGSRFWIELRAA